MKSFAASLPAINTPLAFTSHCSKKSSAVVSMSGVIRPNPALLIRTLTVPIFSIANSNNPCISFSLTTFALKPKTPSFSEAFFTLSSLLPHITTVEPHFFKALAVSYPIPLVAPVITTFASFKSIFLFSSPFSS